MTANDLAGTFGTERGPAGTGSDDIRVLDLKSATDQIGSIVIEERAFEAERTQQIHENSNSGGLINEVAGLRIVLEVQPVFVTCTPAALDINPETATPLFSKNTGETDPCFFGYSNGRFQCSPSK